MKTYVYSCDWCFLAAPDSGSVGSDWTVLRDCQDKVKVEHLCPACAKARLEAIEATRVARLKARQA